VDAVHLGVVAGVRDDHQVVAFVEQPAGELGPARPA
jgi:hypothetical protein